MADIKKIALTIAVGVLLALFVGFLVDAVYSSPKYEDFCKSYNFPIAKEQVINPNCKNLTATIIEERDCSMNKKGYIQYNYSNDGCVSSYYCETCNVKFDDENKIYSRNLFLILAPISIILIIVGFFLSLESIGSGFIFGGILTLIYATARVFGDLSKVMRVVLLGIELVLVLWLGYKKIEKANRKK